MKETLFAALGDKPFYTLKELAPFFNAKPGQLRDASRAGKFPPFKTIVRGIDNVRQEDVLTYAAGDWVDPVMTYREGQAAAATIRGRRRGRRARDVVGHQ